MDNRSYQHILTTVVNRCTDYQLSISGTFEVSRSLQPKISISGIELRHRTDHSYIALQNIILHVDLLKLIRGTLLIKQLQMGTMQINLGREKTQQVYDLSFLKYFPVPIIEDATLNSIVLINRQGTEHTLFNLRVKSHDKQSPLQISASGEIHGKTYHVQGKLGALADLYNTETAYPVAIKGTWQSNHNQWFIHGNIDDPAQLSGLDLQIKVNADDLLLKLSPDVKFHGILQMQAHLSGAFDQAILSDIHILARQGKNSQFEATGSIQNLLTLEGTELHVSGFISNQTMLLNWLPENSPLFNTLNFNADIFENKKHLILDSVQVDLRSEQGLKLNISGKAQLQQGVIPFKNMQFGLTAHSPDTAQINPYLGGFLPEMGAAKVVGNINNRANGIIINDIQLLLGQGQATQLTATGQVDISGLTSPEKRVSMALQLALQSTQSAHFFSLFNIDQVEFGPIKGKATLLTNNKKISLNAIEIHAGNPELLALTTTGRVYWDKNTDYTQHTQLHLHAQSPSLAKALKLYALDLPDIGGFTADLHIQDTDKTLQASQLQFKIGSKETLLISAKGSAEQISIENRSFSGLNISGKIDASSTVHLSTLLGHQAFPDLGSLKGDFIVQGDIKTLTVPEFKIVTGSRVQPDLTGTATINNLLTQQAIKIDLDFNEQALQRLPALSGASEIGDIKAHILLGDSEAGLAIKHVSLSNQTSAIFQAELFGKTENTLLPGKTAINAEISIASPFLLGKLLQMDFTGMQAVHALGHLHMGKQQTDFKGTVQIGATQLKTDLTLAYKMDIPKLSGTVSSGLIALHDLGLSVQKKHKIPAKKTSSKHLFSHKRIAFASLKNIDLALSIKADGLAGVNYEINGFDMDLQLQQGKLNIHPAHFLLAAGKIKLSAEINTQQTTEMALKITGDNINLGRFLAEFESQPTMQGNLDMSVDVRSKGQTAHEIAANLHGNIGFVLEHGSIKQRELEIVFLNLLGWLFSYGVSDNELTISCGIATYQIVQGIANTDLFLLNGPKLLVRAEGEIDLSKEHIDYLVNLEKKKKLFGNTRVPIQIRGDLTDPVVKEMNLGSPFSRLDRYILAPAVEVPAELLGSLWDVVNQEKDTQSPCQQLIANN